MLTVLSRVSAVLITAIIAGCTSSAPVLKSAAFAYPESKEMWGEFSIDAMNNYYLANNIIWQRSDLSLQLGGALENAFNASFVAESLSNEQLEDIEKVVEELDFLFPFDGTDVPPEQWAWGESLWIASVFEGGRVVVMRISFTQNGLVVIQRSNVNRQVAPDGSPSSSENGAVKAATLVASEAYYKDTEGELRARLEALTLR